jgi:cyclophilin family peptidyl-prolyl cis-trans isomerase
MSSYSKFNNPEQLINNKKIMKLINNTMHLLALVLLMSTSSCQDKYPDLEDGLYAEFVTTKGIMVAKLEYEKTPVTVANFVSLAEGNHPLVKEEFKGKKYYNGLTFHRVMDQFMIQGGDPTATGSGDPGYKFGDEFHPDLIHDKPGILSMANSGPGSNGSQFFITEVPYPSVDFRHAVFGELVIGLDVQDSISNVKANENNKPIEDVVMTEVNIIRKGFDAKNFNAPKMFTEELPKIAQRQQELQNEMRKKAEEEQRVREESNLLAAKEIKPILDDYLSKTETLASGLKVYYITKGTGEKPVSGATVKVNYEGYHTDGRLFDSNVQEVEERHGMLNDMKIKREMYQPMPMQISPDAQMISGFKEAAALLKVGDKAFLYMPSHLAYGERGYRSIPPNTDLIFILEMVEIVK